LDRGKLPGRATTAACAEDEGERGPHQRDRPSAEKEKGLGIEPERPRRLGRELGEQAELHHGAPLICQLALPSTPTSRVRVPRPACASASSCPSSCCSSLPASSRRPPRTSPESPPHGPMARHWEGPAEPSSTTAPSS